MAPTFPPPSPLELDWALLPVFNDPDNTEDPEDPDEPEEPDELGGGAA